MCYTLYLISYIYPTLLDEIYPFLKFNLGKDKLLLEGMSLDNKAAFRMKCFKKESSQAIEESYYSKNILKRTYPQTTGSLRFSKNFHL